MHFSLPLKKGLWCYGLCFLFLFSSYGEVGFAGGKVSVSSLLNKGISFSEQGDLKMAGEMFFSASQLLCPDDDPTIRFLVFNNLGRCQVALNRPVSAYHAYKTALIAIKQTDDVEHLLAITENLASLCVRIDKPEEALEYATLASMICQAIHRSESPENYNTRGVAHFLLRHYKKAEKNHRIALEKADESHSSLRLKISENLAADLSAQDQHAEALKLFDEALKMVSLSDPSFFEKKSQSLQIRRIYLQLLAGQENAARKAFAQYKKTLEPISLSISARILMLTVDAELAKRDGEYNREARLRSQMVALIDGQGDHAEDFLLFGANAWRYLDVADAWVRAGNPAEAMRWLEIGRRAEEQNLATQSVSLLENSALVSQIEECKQLGKASRIAKSKADLLLKNGGINNREEASFAVIKDALAIAVKAEKAFDESKEALRKSNPNYWKALFSDRLNVHPDEMNQIANVLPEEVTFIEPVIFRDQVAIFLCSKGKPPICITAPLDKYGMESDVRGLIEKVRFMLSNRTSDVQLKKAVKTLYDILIAPVEDQLKQRETSTLLVSPVGYLRYIPFASLFDGKEYLIQNYAIANVTGLDLIRMVYSENNFVEQAVFVGFANPDGTLPGATEECRQIAGLFRDAEVFQGEQATLNHFLSLSGSATFVHLATHGVLNPNEPEASYLLFADHQKLTYDNMIGMPFLKNLHVLTMSACNTAAASLGDGSEMSGMAYQFVRKSNAGSVVASQWRVDDTATKELMVHFYEQMTVNINRTGSLQRAKSLTFAQRKLLQDSRTEHPFYWAGFVMIGDYR